MTAMWTRRTFVGALAAAGGLVTGCGRSPLDGSSAAAGSGTAIRGGATVVPRGMAMTVYRDPSCGCCEAWAKAAGEAGYKVQLIDRPDMPVIKRRFGVPEELASCHTAVVQGYVIEGHVPLKDVDRLLDERPSGVNGLAVPGMPRGAPGMKVPDGTKDSFTVMAFNAAGESRPF